jgi:hypothetical protein
MRLRVATLLALLLAVPGCCSPARPSPFAPVGEVSDADVVRILRQRTGGVRSLYAVLNMLFEGPQRQGAFDAVMNYRAPATFRFTAYKDLVLTEHDIFDLALRPPSYQVRYEAEGDDGPQLHAGAIADLPRDHPLFSGFAWAGPAFFLAGRLGEDARVRRADERIYVDSTLPGGVPVTYECAPATLEVLGAELHPRGSQGVELRYAGYSKRDGLFFPDRVTYVDRGAGIRITAEAEDVEVDPPLEDALFVLEPQ